MFFSWTSNNAGLLSFDKADPVDPEDANERRKTDGNPVDFECSNLFDENETFSGSEGRSMTSLRTDLTGTSDGRSDAFILNV